MKNFFNSTTVRNIGIILLSVGLFFFSKYGFHCAMEKVCDSVVIDQLVRHDVTVLMPKGALEVEVADTVSSRELGLSGRKAMRNDEGMLFIFDTPGRYGFWMKDMQFPLDIAWINQNGIVVSLERNVGVDTYPKAFINQAEAMYVLEVNAGLMEKFGVYMGSKIKIAE